MGKTKDDSLASEYKKQTETLQKEKAKLTEELKKKNEEFTAYRKQRISEDKQARESKGNWESKERKYQQDIAGYKSEIESQRAEMEIME